MVNRQHIKWLLEGVESWNARMPSLWVDGLPFRPDFEDAPLHHIFQGAGKLDSDGKIPLAGANLFFANLSNANLSFADLTGADLTFANLKGADLSLADLTDAKLEFADLTSASLAGAEPWRAVLYDPIVEPPEQHQNETERVTSIEGLLPIIKRLNNYYSSTTTLYFRGEAKSSWKLCPSVMRDELVDFESEMLVALVSRRPAEFNGMTSALAQWVLARHHGLQTRFLDITKNPLVALFHACDKVAGKHQDEEEKKEEDGSLHIFAVQRSLIKTFDSDTLSIIANIARLRRVMQNVILGRRFASSSKLLHSDSLYSRAMHDLYHLIQQEKPYFDERIDPKSLYRVFVVEPQLSSERIRAQSGAFLVSAFHERFERSEILRWNPRIPVYAHYTLTIPRECKDRIMSDLQLLNITHESLFPGLDSSAKAMTDSYRARKQLIMEEERLKQIEHAQMRKADWAEFPPPLD